MTVAPSRGCKYRYNVREEKWESPWLWLEVENGVCLDVVEWKRVANGWKATICLRLDFPMRITVTLLNVT